MWWFGIFFLLQVHVGKKWDQTAIGKKLSTVTVLYPLCRRKGFHVLIYSEVEVNSSLFAI